jgi:hypothetical protein
MVTPKACLGSRFIKRSEAKFEEQCACLRRETYGTAENFSTSPVGGRLNPHRPINGVEPAAYEARDSLRDS